MKIAFIGFGEAARAFVSTLRETGPHQFSAYDRLQGSGTPAEERLRRVASELGVALAADAHAAVAGTDWIFSAVTAADSLDAGNSVAGALKSPQVFIDINSVSAGRKLETAAVVTRGGAAYVDMAVMAPVHPRGHRTPVLLAGPDCARLEPSFAGNGFAFEIVGGEIGAATSNKMIRSLFVKGLEAITVQALLAAREAGCFDRIYASLSTSFAALGWPAFAEYQLERVATHGVRRAAEMRESARTMEELGFAGGNELASAIASVQDEIGRLGLKIAGGDLAAAFSQVLDARKEISAAQAAE